MKLLLAIMLVLMLIAADGIANASESAPAVVRYDRYLLVNTAPTQPPLEQLTTLTVPPGFHPDLGEALQYLLRDSGYSLCLPDNQRARLYAFPLPLSQYRIGPLRLKAALQMLAGAAWRLDINDARREACFTPQSQATPSLPLTVTDRRPTSRHVLGPATAPFFLAGTMQRGEVRLAVIVPPEARYLNQTVWLRPGEQWRGWRLERLGAQQAVFRHGKRRLTLKITE